VDGIIYFQ